MNVLEGIDFTDSRAFAMKTHVKTAVAAARIYVVDDAPFLTGLYISLLEPFGYSVRAFNERLVALAALKAAVIKPDLLISDYRGLSLPVDQFFQQCLLVYPALRILMVSGFRRIDIHFSRARPDRFIQKPFTLEEFHREVKALLACTSKKCARPALPAHSCN